MKFVNKSFTNFRKRPTAAHPKTGLAAGAEAGPKDRADASGHLADQIGQRRYGVDAEVGAHRGVFDIGCGVLAGPDLDRRQTGALGPADVGVDIVAHHDRVGGGNAQVVEGQLKEVGRRFADHDGSVNGKKADSRSERERAWSIVCLPSLVLSETGIAKLASCSISKSTLAHADNRDSKMANRNLQVPGGGFIPAEYYYLRPVEY